MLGLYSSIHHPPDDIDVVVDDDADADDVTRMISHVWSMVQ